MTAPDTLDAARYRFIRESVTALHVFETTEGQTWRVDFDVDEAADVAFGVSLERALSDAMSLAGVPFPPMPGPTAPAGDYTEQSIKLPDVVTDQS